MKQNYLSSQFIIIVFFFCIIYLLFTQVLLSQSFINGGYNDRGFQLNRTYKRFSSIEYLNPYSGNLILVNNDILLPGNAGMDLHINRIYNSKQIHSPTFGRWKLHEGAFGFGWDFFIARIVPYNGNAYPVAELTMSDGSVYQVYDNNHKNVKDHVKAEFVADNFAVLNYNEITDIWTLRLKDGSVYTFDQQVSSLGAPAGVSYYPSKIIDPNGNTIEIEYNNCCNIRNPELGGTLGSCSQDSNGLTKVPHIKWIKDSAGRVIEFKWLNDSCRASTNPNVITSINLNGQSYDYKYRTVYESGTQNISGYSLIEVLPPAGPGWSYDYDWDDELPNGEIKSVKYPSGGTVEYKFGTLGFDPYEHESYFRNLIPKYTRALISRFISGPFITNGKWTINYGFPDGINTTQIKNPCGSVEKFYFYTPLKNSYLRDWAVSLLYKKEITDYKDRILETQLQEWLPYQININRNIPEKGFFYPLLLNRTINREDVRYTTKYEYDTFYAFPGEIIENENTNGQLSRKTTYEYLESVGNNKYIVGKPNKINVEVDSETKTIINTFNTENGNKLTENRYGVETEFSYYPDGNLRWVKNANGVFTHYNNYDYGKPEIIKHGSSSEDSDSSLYTVERNVNWLGNVSSIKNGRGFTTNYLFDGSGRLTKTLPPEGGVSATTIEYDNKTGRGFIKVKGRAKTKYSFDGFGRLTEFFSNAGINKKFQYDQCGKLIYRSSYYKDPDNENGDIFEYDSLGRLKKIVHCDNTSVDYSYEANSISVENERNVNTSYTYRSFGSPNDKRLIKIIDPDNNILKYEYDIFGNIKKVIQPQGVVRKYNYNSKNLLTSVDTPESGKTKYKYDKIGNIINIRNSEGEVVSYSYDNLNRLVEKDSPSNVNDVLYEYDQANNIILIQSTSGSYEYRYEYGPSNRLTSKRVLLDNGSVNYSVNYSYDERDNVGSINYPSNKRVGYYYDLADRVISIVDGFNNFYLGNISYNPSGFPIQFETAYGVYSEFTYDNRNRVKSIKVSRPYPELHVIKKGLGDGIVKSINILGIDCGKDCRQVYPSKTTTVTLRAIENKNSQFVNWTGDPECLSEDRTISVSMTDNRTCVANFAQEGSTHRLSISKSGSGSGTVKSKPEGIYCGNDCEERYQFNTNVNLKVIPDPDSYFVRWSGDHDCSNENVVMDTDKDCIASFMLNNQEEYEVKVKKSGDGSGKVASNPSGINCGNDCEQIYFEGEKITLHTFAESGSEFTGWIGNKDCHDGFIEVNSNIICVAGFNLIHEKTFTLYIEKSGTGQGVVTSDVTGIDCGDDCYEEYKQNTRLNLNVRPAANSRFVEWEGNSDCFDGELKIDSDITCKAIFESTAPESFELKINKSGEGSGEIISTPSGIMCGEKCAHVYKEGTKVSLEAIPDNDSEFIQWSGNSDCTDGIVNLDESKDCTAKFGLKPSIDGFNLEVNVLGSGTGKITSDIHGIKCGTDLDGKYDNCFKKFEKGTAIKLTVSEGKNSIFNGWEGRLDCVDGEITMDSDEYCVALFESTTDQTYDLTINPSGNGIGYITSEPEGITCGADCSEEIFEYKYIDLNATANPGSVFSGWRGNDDCNDGFVIMDSDKECRPVFEILSDDTLPGITYDYYPRPNEQGWYDKEVIDYRGPVNISFKCEDNSGTGLAACSSPANVSLEGIHEIIGIAEDNEGNSSEIAAPVKIDKTKPVVDITNYEDYDVVKLSDVTVLSNGKGVATIKGRIDDNLSGAYRVRCSSNSLYPHRILFSGYEHYLSNVFEFENSKIIDGSKFECQVELAESPRVSSNEAYITVYDKAGNYSSDSIRLIYYGYSDIIPPDIGNISIQGNYCYDTNSNNVNADISLSFDVSDDISGPDFDSDYIELPDSPIDIDFDCTNDGTGTSLCNGGGSGDADNIYENSRILSVYNLREVTGEYVIADRNGNIARQPVVIDLPPVEELNPCK